MATQEEMAMREENEFVSYWYETIKKENSRRGILFPFLVTKNFTENKMIRAKLIPSSKLYKVCFACLTYQDPGKPKLKAPYNGVFFSPNAQELEEEGLVEIQYFHTKAIVNMYKQDLPGQAMRLYLQVLPDPDSMEVLFCAYNAIYVNNKAMLRSDDVPF